MKKHILIILTLCIFLFTGCSAETNTNTPKENIIIDSKIIETIGFDTEDLLYEVSPTLSDLNVEVYETGSKGIVIAMTPQQKKILAKYYSNFAEMLQKEFENVNNNYKIEFSEDFTEINMYYNSNLSLEYIEKYALYAEITAIINQYFDSNENFAYLLNINIYNCDTNELVRYGNIDNPIQTYMI